MALTIHERDICSELCQTCGACCRVTISLQGTDSRYRVFLRETGAILEPAPQPGARDCCGNVHGVTMDLGYCRHLERATDVSGGISCACRIYTSGALPTLCSEYNCVSWAKSNNAYNDGNSMLRAAQMALDLLRRRKGQHGA